MATKKKSSISKPSMSKPFISDILAIEGVPKEIKQIAKNNIRFEKGLIIHSVKSERWLIDFNAIPDYFKNLCLKFWYYDNRTNKEELDFVIDYARGKYDH